MGSQILVDVGLNETRVAIMEDRELVEYYVERPQSERLVGNIYRGKVCRVLPGMQAAFVDIGYEKNAFLYVTDAIVQKDFNEDLEDVYNEARGYNIEEIVRVGQEITVQVIKEPISTKGPRVTTNITLPGRQLVLLPNATYVGVSRRIQDEGERSNLRTMVEAIKPPDMGFIVRTVSEGKKVEDFENDIRFLEKVWEKIKQKEKSGPVPRCIHKDLGLVYRTVREYFTLEVDKFIINDRTEYNKVLELVDMISPALKLRVEYFSKSNDLFEFYEIDVKINKALSKKVWLRSGGYIIIERTEALTVIDVNTGKFVGKSNLEDTVVKTNVEAAKEIAKQLRLRDIGGIIIIDFIDMNTPENQTMVLETLREALKKDRTKTMVVGMTGLGLIEMTRKKIRQGIDSVMLTDCESCHGSGKISSPETVARKVEKEISQYFTQTIASGILVEVHPDVAQILNGDDGQNLLKIEKTFGKKICIRSAKHIGREDIKIKEVDSSVFVC